MKLTHATCVIGFCPDLTDPDAPVLPVATLAMGDVGELRVAVVVYALPASVQVDPLTQTMLTDVPTLVRRHVDETMATLPWEAPVKVVLFRLHDALRNSLHVSTIDDEVVEELADETPDRDIYQRLLDVAIERLARQQRAAGLPAVFAPASARSRSSSPAPDRVRAFPETRFWSVPRQADHRLHA